jgi:hypothetical protein
MNNKRLETIRELAVLTLQQLGIPQSPWSLAIETSSLRDRDHITSRPRGEGLRAIWLVANEVVEFFNENGELVQRFALEADLGECSEAA